MYRHPLLEELEVEYFATDSPQQRSSRKQAESNLNTSRVMVFPVTGAKVSISCYKTFTEDKSKKGELTSLDKDLHVCGWLRSVLRMDMNF